MAETKKKRKPRVVPKRAINISVWSVNGDPIPSDILDAIENAVTREVLSAFNQGYRLLTQTNKA